MRTSVVALGALVIASTAIADAAPPEPSASIVLSVDATNPASGHLHNHLVIPARPGAMTLAYPKWIPGEHSPTGPLNDVVGLRITADGKALPWRRDPDEMYELTFTVPAGAASIEVDFDSQRVGAGIYSGNAVSNPQIVDVVWNQALLYPKGSRASAIFVEPTVKLPPGWKYATALTGAKEHDGSVSFAKTSLEMLVDSPLVAGAHTKTFDLGTQGGASHSLFAAGENEASLAAPPESVESWKRLVIEMNALFGAHHYERYQFLLVLSDNVPWFGLEHHQSSEDYTPERTLTDPDINRAFPSLLSHEYAHSWNGKYRRPKGLATPSYQEPMRGELLWVYEGLTNYLGWVLAARSGSATVADSIQQLVRDVMVVDRAGRTWRPLADTATSVQLLGGAPGSGEASRRSMDYYPEGSLIWLEADVLIRQKTNGARSLDDFCQRFHGGKTGPAEVKPYDLDEVVRTLNDVTPYDWKTFFDDRIYKVAPKVPLGGIEGAGYHLGTTDKKPELFATIEKVFKFTSYWETLGFGLGEDNGVGDVRPDGPAALAGITPRMKVLAVNGRKVSPTQLSDAIKAGTSGAPIEILTERDGYYRTFKLTYKGGEVYRTIERDAAKPDLLGAILKPRVVTLPPPPPAATPK